MSNKELSRLDWIFKLKANQVSQKHVASRLGLSTRQVRRLYRKFERQGAKGLISKQRGKPSNHQLPRALKTNAIDIITEKYSDFGPTLATEYLHDRHEITLSVETIRQLMITHELWQPNIKRDKPTHQQRERRACFVN